MPNFRSSLRVHPTDKHTHSAAHRKHKIYSSAAKSQYFEHFFELEDLSAPLALFCWCTRLLPGGCTTIRHPLSHSHRAGESGPTYVVRLSWNCSSSMKQQEPWQVRNESRSCTAKYTFSCQKKSVECAASREQNQKTFVALRRK